MNTILAKMITVGNLILTLKTFAKENNYNFPHELIVIIVKKYVFKFKFWNDAENYFAFNKEFCLAINFSYRDIGSYLYEYDPILPEILKLSIEIIHDRVGYYMHSLVKFKPKKQFVIVTENSDYDIKFYEECSSFKKAQTIAKKCHSDSERTNEYGNIERDGFVIINLENYKPWFLKLGILNKRKVNVEKIKFYNT